MDHVAIDLGGRESQICVRRPDGTIVEQRRLRTAAVGAFLQDRAPARVIVETCSEAFWVADLARASGHDVRVVPATLSPALGVGARRLKTDQRDAQILSEVSCRVDLPSVHIPSAPARAAKTVCGLRDGLVRSRTLLINSVRGWLRTQGRRVPSGTVATFGTRVRALLGDGLPGYVARQLAALEDLHGHVTAADAEVRALAQADPVAHRLMTVPGVGPVTAVRFLAALDDPTRFASAPAVTAYLGLVAGQRSSGDRTRHLGITKAGSPAVRWCLVQAAHCARRTLRPSPLRTWVEAVEHRRGRQVATVALARKLAGILFALWRDGSRYDPFRTNTPAHD
ncbi:MAG: IS110 family transposase [Thermoleophilaceae bacterium]|nr:IS110 family transposase [Thermoleophilaceae bacterium]